MPEQSKSGRSQDRSGVAGSQKHETSYKAKKMGTSAGEVRSAVKAAGNSRDKVEGKLGERKGPKEQALPPRKCRPAKEF
jgi:hypothetical protein